MYIYYVMLYTNQESGIMNTIIEGDLELTKNMAFTGGNPKSEHITKREYNKYRID